MTYGAGWKGATRERWTAIAVAGALAAAWVGLGHGGAIQNAAHGVLAVEPVQAAPAPDGAVYGQRCAMCHQTSGMGLPHAFPPLVGTPVTNGDPHFLARIVLYGLQGRTVVNGQPYNTAMAGFAGSMTDAQIAQVLTYIRSSWGNSAPAVDEDVVKEERAKPGSAADNGANYPTK